MKITKLKAVGLKVADIEMDLKPITVVVGDNFAGKSARLEAVRLVLLGYLPEHGKTNAATFGLARGARMEVEAEMDNGIVLCHLWETTRGTVKHTSSDKENVTPPAMLDPSVYFALGDKDRLRYVFGLAGQTGLDSDAMAVKVCESVARLVGAIVSDKDLNDTARALQLEHHRRLVEEIEASDSERHEGNQSTHEWLTGMLASFKDRSRVANEERTRMVKSVEGLVQVDLGGNGGADVSRDLAAKRSEYEMAHAHLGTLTERRRAYEAHVLAVGQANIEAGDQPIDSPDVLANQADALKVSLMDVEKKLKPLLTGLVEIATKSSQLRSEIGQLMKDNEYEQKAFDCITGPRDICPTCAKPGWTGDHRHELDISIARRSKRIYSAQKQLVEVEAEMSEQEQKAGALRQTVDSLRAGIGQLDASRSVAKAQLELRARLEAVLAKTAPENPTDQEMNACGETLGRLNVEIVLLTTKQRCYEASKAALAHSLKTREARDKAIAAYEVLRLVLVTLEGCMERFVAEAFGGLLRVINRFTAEFIPEPIEYRGGELGRMVAGTWVSHATFSGVEKSLVYSGMGIALASGSLIKIVVIDELSRLTGENKAKLVHVLRALIKSGTIDQCLMADPDARFWAGWNDGHAGSELVQVIEC
jgi:hypothetical protein